MDVADALEFAKARQRAVLATNRKSGRPQLSNVSFYVEGNGAISVSALASRAKTHNLKRDPRASLHVTDEGYDLWVTVECDVDVSASAQEDPRIIDDLVAFFGRLGRDGVTTDAFRETLIDENRLMLALRPRHAYGNL